MPEKLIKLSEKGEIVIPKELREELDLRSGAELSIQRENNHLRIDRAKDPMEILNAFLTLREKYGIKPQKLTIEELKRYREEAYEARYKKWFKK